MTDDPDLTPEQERDVRRMLADARHAEPMPGDVVARLDRVLAELAAGEHASPSPVADLASHRRRRVATLLVAAAAVVVAGIGIDQVLPSRSGDSGSSADSPMSAEQNADSAGGAAKAGRDQSSAAGNEVAPDPLATYSLRKPFALSEQRFSSDVRRARQRAYTPTDGVLDGPLNSQSGSASALVPEADAGLTLRGFDCPAADWGAGVFVPVTYAGDPAVLVFRRASGDTQVADLFQCGSSVVLRSITLPAG